MTQDEIDDQELEKFKKELEMCPGLLWTVPEDDCLFAIETFNEELKKYALVVINLPPNPPWPCVYPNAEAGAKALELYQSMSGNQVKFLLTPYKRTPVN